MASPREEGTGHKLFVGNLPTDCAVEELQMVFSTYGEVTHIHMMSPSAKTGQRCAFVFYSRRESAEDAIKVLDGVYKIREDAPTAVQVRWPRDRQANDSSDGQQGWGAGGGASAGPTTSKEGHKLFVGGLPADVSEEELRIVFSTYGEVNLVHIMDVHPRTGMRCAFIFYARQESAEDAIKVLDNVYKIREDARDPIQVRWASKEPANSRSQWGGGSSGGKGWDSGWQGGSGGWQGKGWQAAQPSLGWQDDGWQSGGKGGGWQSSGGSGGWGGGGDGGKGRSWQGQAPTSGTKLYVANLPGDLQPDALEYVFGTYGKVTKVHLLTAKAVNGCISAFVELSSSEDAETAITSLDGKYEIRPGNGPIVVKHATIKPRSAPY